MNVAPGAYAHPPSRERALGIVVRPIESSGWVTDATRYWPGNGRSAHGSERSRSVQAPNGETIEPEIEREDRDRLEREIELEDDGD